MTVQTKEIPAHMLLPLDSPVATLALVGGKGANLAKLAQANFPVPGGFLVTTEAYRTFVTANQLAAVIEAALATVNVNDPSTLETASSAIRARFATGSIPLDLAESLRTAYQALGQPPVAVRSSATAEDLPDMSFAGQQDTYLNILGEDALLKAVINCWSSLWTARAIGYRTRNNIAHSDVALSVVVQAMVQSEASGVLFTVNPLTGKRSETVIDATLGLGEALVSGQVEPDHYVVETKSGRILHKILGAKALAIRGESSGGTTTIHEDASQRQALPDTVIQQLATLGRKVADFYGAPQDVEWAWAEGKLFLLQARPVTSLYPTPPGTAAEPLEIFASVAAIQGVLDPLTPLGRDGLQTVFSGLASLFGFDLNRQTQTILYSAGERLWARITPLVNNTVGRKFILAATTVVEPSIRQALLQVVEMPTLAKTGSPQPEAIRHLLRFLWPRLRGVVRSLLWPEQNRQAVERQVAASLQATEAVAARATTLKARIELFETTMQAQINATVPVIVSCMPAGLLAMYGVLAIADQTWAHDEKQKQRALEITRGLPHNVTTEMDLLLWSTAQKLRTDAAALAAFQQQDAATLAQQYLANALPKVAQTAISAFLKQYGMRGVAEIDIGRSRWRENPTQVMQIVQSYLRIEDPNLAPDALFRRGDEVAQQVIAELAQAVRQQPNGALKAWLARWLAQRMRALAGLREMPKFFLVQLLGIVRQALRQSGVELAQQGVLASADDIFFLHIDELKGLAAGYLIDWRALVAERRALYEREKLRRQVPRLLLSDGQAFYDGIKTATPKSDGVLTGMPVSPGVVEGTVHVVFDPHASQLAPGEILVCPGTDPAWTPLFMAAGGLVMEVGGLMTHGSVVAREYGIPAVVGVHEATSRLKTGQRIRVDGSSGEVVVLG